MDDDTINYNTDIIEYLLKCGAQMDYNLISTYTSHEYKISDPDTLNLINIRHFMLHHFIEELKKIF